MSRRVTLGRAGTLLLASVAVLAQSGKSLSEKLEEQYLHTLDGWVAKRGPMAELQRTVVGTCGKFVMLTASSIEKVTLATTQRKEFDFRVDVCVQITVNRVYPQPDFKNKEAVAEICDKNPAIPMFNKLCKWSKLR